MMLLFLIMMLVMMMMMMMMMMMVIMMMIDDDDDDILGQGKLGHLILLLQLREKCKTISKPENRFRPIRLPCSKINSLATLLEQPKLHYSILP